MLQLETILIVDDSQLNNAMLSDILSPHYRVIIANNGSAALHIASTERINMVLLDIMMPGIDGYAVCHSLKSIPALAEIPILFISALSTTSDIVHAFKTGGADYITKPYQAEEVLARVGVHLRLQRSKAEIQSLLSQTMNGVIEIITDLLTSKYPTLVRHVNQMRANAAKMMQLLSIEPQACWYIDTAIRLSHAGCLNLPHDLVKKRFSGAPLTDDETAAFNYHPILGAQYVSHIPRVDKVAGIIRNQLIHPAKLNQDLSDLTVPGQFILNLLLMFETYLYQGYSPNQALDRMKKTDPPYPPLLVGALEQIIASEYVLVEKEMLYEDLKPGMVLMSPIINRSGVKLLPVGMELTESHIQNILGYYRDRKLLLSTVNVMDYKSR